VSNPFCPLVAPFNVVVGVNLQPNGGATVFVTSVRAQFTDSSGVQMPQVTLPMPQVTLPAPLPTTGSMVQTVSGIVIPVSGTTIPLTIPIGCAGGRQGTLVVVVVTSDDAGRSSTQQLSISVM